MEMRRDPSTETLVFQYLRVERGQGNKRDLRETSETREAGLNGLQKIKQLGFFRKEKMIN